MIGGQNVSSVSDRAGPDGVRVTVHEGSVAAVDLDPQLMRLPGGPLGGLVAQAISSALAASAGPAATAPAVQALHSVLVETECQARATFDAVASGLGEAIRRIGPRSGMRGDPSPLGVGILFTEAARQVASLPDRATPTASGEASTPGGARVRVTVRPGVAVVESVELEAQVLRQGATRTGEAIRTAVNAALAQARQSLADLPPPPPVDVAGLRALRELGVQQMRDYAGALAAIVASIQPPDGGEA